MRFGIVLPTYLAGATGATVEGVLAVAEAAEVLLRQLRPDVRHLITSLY
jgi:hypothetical protein